jgi:hypothetical protein
VKPWLASKFDNFALIFLIIFFVSLLTWVDKHGNGDYEKWLMSAASGVIGCYLGLIQGARQAWNKAQQNGNQDAKKNGGDVAVG